MFYKHVFIGSNIHICITDRPIGLLLLKTGSGETSMSVNHQTPSVILFTFYEVGFASPISMWRDGEINVLQPLFGMLTLPRYWRRRTGVRIFRLRNLNVRKDKQRT